MERANEREAMDLILYYGREGLYHHIVKVCDRMLAKMGETPVFRFWRGVAVCLEGGVAEALRSFREVEGRREIQIAADAAGIWAHRQNRRIDQHAIDELEAKLLADERDATEGAWMQMAAFCWMVGDHGKAKDACQKVENSSNEYLNSNSILGWINLTSGRVTTIDRSFSCFEKALDPNQGGSPNHVDAALGKVAYLDQKRQYPQALQVLNEISVTCSKGSDIFIPVTLEKAKILIKQGDWEQAAETTQRILTKDPRNVQALMLIILFRLTNECNFPVVHSHLKDLLHALEEHEPKTPNLYYYITRTLARLSGGSRLVLEGTEALISKACELQKENAEYHCERAYQLSLSGDWNKSLEAYKHSLTLDDGNINALNGQIRCQIMLGKLDEAEQQLNFLNEIQVSTGRTADLCYLLALMKWRKHRDQQGSIQSLDEAVDIHLRECHGVPSYEFYYKLNPQFLLSIVREYLQHCPTEPLMPTDPPSPVTTKSRKPLEVLLEHVKGSLEGQLLLARIEFIQNDLEKAQNSINACIRYDHSFAEAHLLAAQIAFHQENFEQAQAALDQALVEFEVRDWPQYNLLKAKLSSIKGNYEESLKDLEAALNLTKQVGSRKKYRPLNVQDHVAIYLELAQVNMKQRDASKAEQTITEALREFRDTPEEGRIVIAQAMVFCKKDIEKALSLLRSVKSTSPYFLKAKAQMAHIYLSLRNNKRAFAKCYEELVEAFPTGGSYVRLGEAYMSIQEPEKAIAAFEKARDLEPNEAEMATRIGKAFITTHDYQKAIQYYKNAVQSEPQKLALRHDLAILYWRLGKYEEAEAELQQCMERKQVQDNVRTMLLLAKVYKAAGDTRKASDALIKARVYQNTVLTNVRAADSPEITHQQRAIASNICYELGEYYREQRVPDQAVMYHNEALKQDETNEKSMLALAKLYRDKNDLKLCEDQCNSLLRIDPTNEEASMMLADLMFRNNRYDDATFHFQQLLEKKPGNCHALIRFIELLRRAGRLFEAPRFIQAAENHVKSRMEPGLHYAKGMYNRYTNNPKEALKEFNKGRHPRDTPWAEKCACNMIEIYLNPDSDSQFGETAEGEERVDLTENIQWAQKLLREVHDKTKKRILEAYILLARKRKEDIDKAVGIFSDMITPDSGPEGAQIEKVNVPCLVGLATAHYLQKQTPKAKTFLKRVAKAPVVREEADDFERGWLLLAHIQIQSSKYDLATELLRKCLEANKSCCRAWELMGLIYEKEQSYVDAAYCYENAWRLVSESDPGIGYKLAFNYLKARRYVSAIDVTQKVLTSHPQYPKIRRDILDKARSSLRP